MAELTKLSAGVRTVSGKGPVGRLRRAGRVPGVVYGGEREPVMLQVDAEEFQHLMHGAASEQIVLELAIEGEEEPRSVLIQEIQHDVITDAYLHIDFHEVSLTEKLRARIPLEPRGEAAGVKTGGVLEQIMHEIEVECLPTDLPRLIEADVSALEVGDSLHVKDLEVPENVRLVPDPELVVILVAAARVVEEVEEVEEEAAEEAAEGEGEGAAETADAEEEAS
jgi:large subunit ribosomal protein L25